MLSVVQFTLRFQPLCLFLMISHFSKFTQPFRFQRSSISRVLSKSRYTPTNRLFASTFSAVDYKQSGNVFVNPSIDSTSHHGQENSNHGGTRTAVTVVKDFQQAERVVKILE